MDPLNLRHIEEVYGLKLNKRRVFELFVLLICAEVVMAFSYLGRFSIGSVTFSTLFMLVLVAALYFGPWGGIILGLACAILTEWQVASSYVSSVDLVFSLLKSGAPFQSFIVNYMVSMGVGVAAGFAYRVFLKRKYRHPYLSLFVLSFALAALQYLSVCFLIALFFPDLFKIGDMPLFILNKGLSCLLSAAATCYMYRLPKASRLAEKFRIVTERDAEGGTGRMNRLTVHWVGVLAMLLVIVSVFFLKRLQKTVIQTGIGGEALQRLYSAPFWIIIQTLITLFCLLIFIYVITKWMREYYNSKILRANEELREAADSANRAKTRFLFNMSHDIRTPMNAIMGYTRLSKARTDDPEAVAGYLSKIEVAGKHLMDLINDVLDMSRIEAGSAKLTESPVPLAAAMDDLDVMTAELAKAGDVGYSFENEIPRDTAFVCDLPHLKQIVLNITSNAVKYTPAGGRVSITARVEAPGEDGLVPVQFRVKDTGIGMDAEFLKHVFEPFSRSDAAHTSGIQGTGLGMSIVKNLTELLKGEIRIDSEPGKGTDVQLFFRFATAPLPEEEAAPVGEDVELSGMRILLVDDNEMNREIAVEILEELEAVVETAEDGDIAVEKVMNAAKSLDGLYDVVLMDVQMPRMDGYAATRAIRALPGLHDTHLPIIAMTANAFEEDVKTSLDAGMDAHLSKPIDVSKLVKALTRIRDKRASRAE